VLALKGENERAREAFGESLVKTPNNAWALYGLAQSYSRLGKQREAREIERRLDRAWLGERSLLALERLS